MYKQNIISGDFHVLFTHVTGPRCPETYLITVKSEQESKGCRIW